jgi:hypothetical protein
LHDHPEDGNLNSNGHRVSREHEALDFIMAAVVVRHSLEHEIGGTLGMRLL